MVDDTTVETIRTYIRAHRDDFTRTALTERLVAAGHDMPDIEAAWAAIEAEDRSGRTAGPSARARRTAREFGYLVFALYGAAGLLAVLAIPSGGAIASETNDLGRLWLVAYVVGLVAGAVVVRRILRRATWGRIALGLVASVLIFAGLAGACLVGLGM